MSKLKFRKKSLEQISSPEKLNDYLKGTGLSMWLILAALLLLLAAALFWGMAAELEAAACRNGEGIGAAVRLCFMD